MPSESRTPLEHDVSPSPPNKNSWLVGDRYLIQSPYADRRHLLDLQTLETPYRLIALALTRMRNVTEDFRVAPYAEAFNFPEIVGALRESVNALYYDWKETHFYIVVFRSCIPKTTNYAHLGALDEAAHAEAVAGGGFLKYWFGDPDEQGRNLATCLWRSRDDAARGSRGPDHAKAGAAARHLYTFWKIERHRFIIRDGVKSWDLVDC